jgi:hypothetical protein
VPRSYLLIRLQGCEQMMRCGRGTHDDNGAMVNVAPMMWAPMQVKVYVAPMAMMCGTARGCPC